MLTAWDNHREEYAAGVADSIEKDFAGVNQLYTGAPDGPKDATDPSGLPIFGGELVSREDGPPFLTLRPHQVAEAGGGVKGSSPSTSGPLTQGMRQSRRSGTEAPCSDR